MRQRLCRACGGWHDLDEPWPFACVPVTPDRRATGIPTPMFVSDHMEETEHVDGNLYTSKSEYRKVSKAHGLVEIGNDPARLRTPVKPKADPKALRDAVSQGQAMVANGWRPR